MNKKPKMQIVEVGLNTTAAQGGSMSIVTDKSSLDDFLDDYRGICDKHNLMLSGLLFVDPLDKERLHIQIAELYKERIRELREG